MDLDSSSPPKNNITNNNSATNDNVAGSSSTTMQQQQQVMNSHNMMMATTSSSSNPRSNYDIDVLRLIGQHLHGMGLTSTVDHLLQESGLNSLDHPLAIEFQRFILAGEWDKASSLVEELINLVISTQHQPHQQQLLTPMQHSTNSNATAVIASPPAPLLSATVDGESTAQITCLLSNGHAQANSTTTTSASSSVASTAATTPTINNNHLESVRIRSIREMRYAIAEQKFLELLDDNQTLSAIKCLRLELTPLSENVEIVQQIALLLMCKSNDEVRLKANWPGKGLQSRQTLFEKLSQYIPPPILMPPKRLNILLEQAQQLQREHCILHIDQNMDQHRLGLVGLESTGTTEGSVTNGTCDANGNNNVKLMTDGDNLEQTNGNCATSMASLATSPSTTLLTTNGTTSANNATLSQALPSHAATTRVSYGPTRESGLSQDHICSADRFPLTVRQDLDSHESEVWFCRFSNDGRKLATGGVGGVVKIWELDPHERKLVEKLTLECNNSYSVSCLSWSPNDTHLLACGSDNQPDLWLWNINKGQLHIHINHKESQQDSPHEEFMTCSWHSSGERFAAASLKGNLCIFDLDGNKLGSRESIRAHWIAFLNKDPDYILVADTLNRIKMYAHEDSTSLATEEEDVLQERDPIMSFTIDEDDRYLAVNILEQGIHLWDFRLKILLRIFPGVNQRTSVIHSSFSSPSGRFLASGSEDARVYIYSVHKDQPVAILQGHTRYVNCVSWNPKYPELLVSVSDDRTVKLWAPIDRAEMITTTASMRAASALVGRAAVPNASSRWIREINYSGSL